MLTRLQVRNYVLIDSLDIDFPEGLIIITGQTGAGKSILLGALSLIMGSKADASVVSDGADNCVVEAEFQTGDISLRPILEDNDVEWEDGNLIIRRVVNRSGRSRAFVNDSPVPVSVLQEISSRLIDVHSQHQTMLLSDKSYQLDILDHYAGNMDLRAECAGLWKELAARKSEYRQLEDKLTRLAGERDYNEAQLRQLEAASLKPGELAELEEEQKQLANAEEIKTGLSLAEELFTASSSGGEALSIDAALKEAEKVINKVGRFVPSVLPLAERVASCRLELDDVLSEIESINSRTDLSESRLEEVDARISLIYGLMQKHSCRDEQELIEFRDSLCESVSDSSLLEERKTELLEMIAVTESRMTGLADRLHSSRMEASVRFSEAITESVRSLELPYAVFEAEVAGAPMSASGSDTVMFRFSSTGKNAVDVAKCASGGEKSRIMLALKAMMAEFTHMPTMIFDEIDTGVSGSVADRMGSMICGMGTYMQVFAITHLPQVAAKGTAHYMVSKEIDPVTAVAVSTIARLSDRERVMEVARMLSGSVLTDAAVANAESLLGL